jgi:hypothetical protein
MQPFLRSALILSILFSQLSVVSAQFGLSAAYRLAPTEFSQDDLSAGGTFNNGYAVTADYWFRLPTKRIEFLPTIGFSQFDGNYSVSEEAGSNLRSTTYDINEYSIQFKTNFYLFDLGTDCDCPVWGKQGPALHKGFYVQLAPGFSHFRSTVNSSDPNLNVEPNGNQSLFSLGAGIGIDFGISNAITLTPQVNYRRHLGDYNWSETSLVSPTPTQDPITPRSTLTDFQFGLRLGIRLDERRY